MAYAGICVTDDLQPHSDPYFSQRSLQEISTYTSSNQAAINEVQTVSLLHFGGGNEVQVVSFGPGYAPTADDPARQLRDQRRAERDLARRRGGERQHGHDRDRATRTRSRSARRSRSSGVANAGYNGTFTVTAVPTTRSFQYTNPVAGLPTSGGGTVTFSSPCAERVREHRHGQHLAWRTAGR